MSCLEPSGAVYAAVTAERKGLDPQLDSQGTASIEAALLKLKPGTDTPTTLLIIGKLLKAPQQPHLHYTMLQRQGTMSTT